MNAYTVLLIIFVCEMEALPNEFWPNVGTVLFTREDLNRRMWSKRDISMLIARRHFQNLIPPPSFIDVEKDFVDKMLNYFRDTYTAIKRASPDHEVDRIMTTALSDTIGGYLKLCVLPVTKLSFYGGMTSYEHAYKVFKFYSEIKRYLCTDGSSWQTPDIKMLNALILNVPKVVRYKKQMLDTNESTRNNFDPCTPFSYFEKSPEGLVVPMPVVNWDDVTMFLPVYNESTFSLQSPKHCNTLENYYNKARTCMNSKSEASATDFDTKFQSWLTSDILPHLKDDRLYVALGNVLGLLNKTKATCDVLLRIYNSSSPKEQQPDYMSFFCSKTTIIVIIIIIFEIIWCIVAIDRLCCKKKLDFGDNDPGGNRIISFFQTCTDRERSSSRDMQEFEVNRTRIANSKPSFMQRWSGNSNYNAMEYEEDYLRQASYPMTVDSRCQNRPSVKYKCSSIGVGTQSRSQSSFRCQIRSSDVLTIVNEKIKDFTSRPGPMTKPNRSYTKAPCSICGVIGCTDSKSCTCDPENINETESRTIANNNSTAIAVFRSQKNVEGSQAIYETNLGNAIQIGKTVSECNESVFELRPYSTPPVPYVCPNGTEESDISLDLVKISTMKEAPAGSLIYMHENPTTLTNKGKIISEKQMVIMRVDKETETNVEHVMKSNNLVNKSTNSVAVSMPKDKKGKQSLRKRYLEIKIDRPKAEIKLGISDGQQCIRKGPSKIPTRKSMRHAASSTTKRQIEAATMSPEYVDKSVNSVIQFKQSTDYSLTQACTVYQVSTGKDNTRVFQQTPHDYIKNYIAPATSLSEQDDTTVSKSSNTEIQSMTTKQEQSSENKSDKEDLSLITIKRNESNSSKMSSYSDIMVPCINLKEVAIIEGKNNGSSIDEDTSIMTDKERLIHTIYEHSKEALLAALATGEEKTVKEQIIKQPSERIIESNDEQSGSQKSYIISKSQVKAKVNPETSFELRNTDINPDTSKILKHQKIPEPDKIVNKQEQSPETMKTKIHKRSKYDKVNVQAPRSPETSLIKCKTSKELQCEREQSSLTFATENLVEMSSIVLKETDKCGDTGYKRQEEDDGGRSQVNSFSKRKSKIPQLVRIGDTHAAKTLNTDIRLNLSF